jgi:alanyl aminopeptidase
MRPRSSAFVLALVLAGCPQKQVAAPPPVVEAPPAASPAPPPPAPQAASANLPGVRLPRTFLPTGYDARLELDPAKDSFAGTIAITGKLATASSTLWLHGKDLTIRTARARSGAKDIALTVTPRGEDFLEIQAAEQLAAGTWTLAFDYTARFDLVSTTGAFKQTVGDASYVYSQFEAVYARQVFPCFDEPDNKVPWRLTLDVPAKLTAVANAPIASESPLDGGKKRVEFAVSKPLPTYLIAFGVGPFEIVDAGKTRRGTPVRVMTLARRGADAAYAAKTGARIVDLSEDWFGTPYPYEKLDLVTIPLTIGFGAMENAGLITFTESLMLLDGKASKERQRRWVVVAAHEIAHQWFGNLVTMGFWDDIWLNEGFANWLEAKIADKFDPSWQETYGELETLHHALSADSLVSARKIRQPIATPDDILSVFDGITYNKSASVLNMFEAYVGPTKFQQGVRDYLAARAWGNATFSDFSSAMSKAAGQNLDAAFASFLDHTGAPEITATLTCGRTPTVELLQKRYVPPGSPPATGGPWIVPVCVAYDRDGKRAEACTLLERTTGTLALEAKACPRWVMPNAEGRGYYRSAYTTQQLTALRDEAWPQLSPVERRALYFDVASSVASGRVSLALSLSFVPRLLAGNDRFTVDAALSTPTGLAPWVPDALRAKYEYWLRTTFGPGAAEVGLATKPTDTLDMEMRRRDLVEAVGWLAREPALVAEAVQLASSWRDLPQGIRKLVLQIAVDADAPTFDRIIKDVYMETDRARRNEMFDALAAVRDPARQARALALVIDRKLDIRETIRILQNTTTESGLATSQAFFRANQRAIVDRLPKEATVGGAGTLGALFTRTCRQDKRDEIAAYVTEELSHFPGAKQLVREYIESMDQCIAKRNRLEPELRAWLGGIKIPKTK